MWLRSSCIVVVLGCFTGSAYGQGLASVRGTATDPTGAVVPGVAITVTNAATGLTRDALTNETGAYLVTQLPPPGLIRFVRSCLVSKPFSPTKCRCR